MRGFAVAPARGAGEEGGKEKRGEGDARGGSSASRPPPPPPPFLLCLLTPVSGSFAGGGLFLLDSPGMRRSLGARPLPPLSRTLAQPPRLVARICRLLSFLPSSPRPPSPQPFLLPLLRSRVKWEPYKEEPSAQKTKKTAAFLPACTQSRLFPPSPSKKVIVPPQPPQLPFPD